MYMYYNLQNVISWLCEDLPYLLVVTNMSSFTTRFIPKHHCCHGNSGDNLDGNGKNYHPQ